MLKITRRELWTDSIFEVFPHEIDDQKLYNFYQELSSKEGVQKSNRGGWQKDVHLNECEELDELVHQLTMATNHIIQDVFKFSGKVEMNNMWLNANRYGHSNVYHTHPGACFSAVYYIKSNNSEDCGQIGFTRQESHSIAWIKHLLGDDEDPSNTQFNVSSYLNPIQGIGYIFPSWYGHQVTPNLTNDERVILALNFS